MKEYLLGLFFPPKCVLCGKLLKKEETDLCHHCREHTERCANHKIKLSFLAQWIGLWYYKDTVRASILRYKFGGRRSYAAAYGRLLGIRLQAEGWDQPQVLTWIPISRLRRIRRGYDQTELFAEALSQELGIPLIPTLQKIRNTRPQSLMGDAAHRRANILGAFQVLDPEAIRGKEILLLDDILTTGATASEAARMLLTAGAKEVKLATLAVASYEKSR